MSILERHHLSPSSIRSIEKKTSKIGKLRVGHAKSMRYRDTILFDVSSTCNRFSSGPICQSLRQCSTSYRVTLQRTKKSFPQSFHLSSRLRNFIGEFIFYRIYCSIFSLFNRTMLQLLGKISFLVPQVFVYLLINSLSLVFFFFDPSQQSNIST